MTELWNGVDAKTWLGQARLGISAWYRSEDYMEGCKTWRNE